MRVGDIWEYKTLNFYSGQCLDNCAKIMKITDFKVHYRWIFWDKKYKNVSLDINVFKHEFIDTNGVYDNLIIMKDIIE